MTMTDPIADMLTRLRNGAAVGQTSIRMPASKLKKAVADVLKETGWVESSVIKDGVLVVELATDQGTIKLSGLKRVSKPGRRLYVPSGNLPRVRRGLGTAVISTSQGVMSASTARKRRLGGEVMLEVF